MSTSEPQKAIRIHTNIHVYCFHRIIKAYFTPILIQILLSFHPDNTS